MERGSARRFALKVPLLLSHCGALEVLAPIGAGKGQLCRNSNSRSRPVPVVRHSGTRGSKVHKAEVHRTSDPRLTAAIRLQPANVGDGNNRPFFWRPKTVASSTNSLTSARSSASCKPQMALAAAGRPDSPVSRQPPAGRSIWDRPRTNVDARARKRPARPNNSGSAADWFVRRESRGTPPGRVSVRCRTAIYNWVQCELFVPTAD